MELLDPYRFTRGVKIRGRRDLDEVMVRRLKEDIRQVQGGFPKRNVERLVVDDLPPDAPELVLSRLLDEYRTARERRHATASKRAQAATGLLVVGLQQRLLSSIEAFARSLKLHRETVLRHWNKAKSVGDPPQSDGGYQSDLYTRPPGSDDERGELTDEDADAEDSAQTLSLTEASERGATVGDRQAEMWTREQELLDEMQRVAEATKHLPDAKTRCLIDWLGSPVPGIATVRREAQGLEPKVERPSRPDLHRESPRYQVLPAEHPSTGRRVHRPGRRSD